MLFLDAIPPFERVRLCGELATAIAQLHGELAPLSRVQVAKQVIVLLNQLGAKEEQAARVIDFSLSDKAGSSRALDDYLENGLTDLPASLAPFEADTVASLARTIGSDAVAEAARQMQRLQLMRVSGGIDGAHLDAYEEIASRGVKPGIDGAAVIANVDRAAEIMRQKASQNPEAAEVYAQMRQMNEQFDAADLALAAKIRAERQLIGQGAGNSADMDALQRERADIYERYKADFHVLKVACQELADKFHASNTRAVEELFEQDGEAVLLAIRAASPVSQAEAEAWASRQVVDDNAMAKLSRMGYKKDALYRDLAEFYRLTGGKSSAVRISTSGRRRASAVGVETRLDEKVINLGTNFDKGVLFHELAHFLENDPIAKAASNGFLVKRRESSSVHSLRSLTDRNYDSREVAYKDSFMDAYIGKVYRDGVTEVFSMGVQYLASPKDAAIFAAKDPEMFAMISGYLTSELTPAMSAKLNMHVGAIDTLQAKRQDEDDQYTKALSSLSSRAGLTMDSWWSEQQEANSFQAQQLEHYAFTRGKPPKFVGSNGEYHVFEGVFLNKNTSRKAKGHLVAFCGTGTDMTEYAAIHGGLDLARAFIVVAREQGLRLTQTWYNLFYEKAGRDPKKAIISTAQSISGALQ